VLLPLALALGFGVLGLLVVAKVAHVAMTRLGLDVFSVLTWFGLADPQPSFGNSAAGAATLYRVK
jgi:hypothetical protein